MSSSETISYTKIIKESEKALLVAIRQQPQADSFMKLMLSDDALAEYEAEASQTLDYWVPKSVIQSHDSESQTMDVANWWLRKNGLSI